MMVANALAPSVPIFTASMSHGHAQFRITHASTSQRFTLSGETMEVTATDPQRHPLTYHAAHSDGRSIMHCDDEECKKYARFMEVLRGSGYK